MAAAKECDICGRLYKPYNKAHDSKKTNGIMFINVTSDTKYYANECIDCCPECMESIRNFVNKLKEGE